MKHFWMIALFLGANISVLCQDSPKVDARLTVVRAMVEAFNAHDVEAMIAHVHEDVAWLNLNGNGISVEVEGSAALAEGMTSYFASIPTARAEIVSEMTSGPYVILRERAFWKTKDGERSQSALAVYEVRDGKVKRVWYYPAEPN